MEFNWKFYIENYPDFKKIGINNYNQALSHWRNHGKKEGRISYFDYKNYILNNKDLIEEGIRTAEKAFNHWLNRGRFEQRKIDSPNLYNAISVNSIFDQVYLINLKEDTVKLERMKKKLDELNISYNLFEAINGNKLTNKRKIVDRDGVVCGYGAYGCKLSHIEILEDAKRKNYNKILILEDDLFFDKEFNKKFKENYFDLIINRNTDYKLLYLGSNKFRGNIYGGFAYVIDLTIIDLILPSTHDNRPIDDIYVEELQNNSLHKTLEFTPNIITVNVMNSKTNNNNTWNFNGFTLILIKLKKIL